MGTALTNDGIIHLEYRRYGTFGYITSIIVIGLFFGSTADFLSPFLVFAVSLIPLIGVVALATLINVTIGKPIIAIQYDNIPFKEGTYTL